MESLELLALNRQLSTGVPYGSRPVRPRTPTQQDEAHFDSFTRDAYSLWREQLRSDVGFFLGLCQRRALPAIASVLKEFGYLVGFLRNGPGHHPTKTEQDERRAWLNDQTWSDAIVEFEARLDEALAAVAWLSGLVRGQPELSSQWRGWLIDLDPEAILDQVAKDLGRYWSGGPNDQARRVKLRNLTNRRDGAGNRADMRAFMVACAIGEVLHDKADLPVDYVEVLDMLGLLGDRRAQSALRLALAVAQSNKGLQGDEFLDRVAHLWKEATRS